MPWNKEHYPTALKYFSDEVRSKTIEIANALLAEGYQEGHAIPIAIATAKRWIKKQATETDYDALSVIPHPEGWAVRRTNARRASFIAPDARSAYAKASEWAKYENLELFLYDENGALKQYCPASTAMPMRLEN